MLCDNAQVEIDPAELVTDDVVVLQAGDRILCGPMFQCAAGLSGYQQPATLRAQVLTCGAILGRAGRQIVLHLSKSWGGLAQRIPLLDSILNWQLQQWHRRRGRDVIRRNHATASRIQIAVTSTEATQEDST